MRVSVTSVTVAVVAAVLLAASFTVSLLVRPSPVRMFSGSQDPRELAALTAYLRRHGGVNCHPFKQTATRKSAYLSNVRAVASVACDTVGAGPDSIVGVRFRTQSDLAAWEYDHHSYVAASGRVGTCDVPATGEGWWSSGGSGFSGRIFCEPSGDRGGGLAWTDQAVKSGFYVSSSATSVSNMLQWWYGHAQRHRAPDADGLRAIRKELTGYLKGGSGRCETGRAPLADAVLRCGRVTVSHPHAGYVDRLSAYHFQSGKTMSTFFDEYKTAYRAPTDSGSGYCDNRALYSATYNNTTGVAGSIFCFPYNGEQYLLYTIDADDIAILLERFDADARAIYKAFQWLPG